MKHKVPRIEDPEESRKSALPRRSEEDESVYDPIQIQVGSYSHTWLYEKPRRLKKRNPVGFRAPNGTRETQ